MFCVIFNQKETTQTSPDISTIQCTPHLSHKLLDYVNSNLCEILLCSCGMSLFFVALALSFCHNFF